METILKYSLRALHRIVWKIESRFDSRYLTEGAPQAKKINHQDWPVYLQDLANKQGMRILEVGSREVTCISNARKNFSKAEYIGFDYHPGENVDVVGDAHKLSSYFNEDEKFDLVYSSACFEHFAMPWVVAKEMSKLVKVGGFVFVETHFAFSLHERPWHFFHFTDMGLKVLFSKALGFECVEAGFSNPIAARFSSYAVKYLVNKPVTGLYCHCEYLGKKIKEVENFDWEKVRMQELVGDTSYPEPRK